MAQFDVHRVRGGTLIVDCQSDALDALVTRFVIPLVPADRFTADQRLAPVFDVDEQAMVLMTPLARTVHVRDLETAVTSLAADRYLIQRAIDYLPAVPDRGATRRSRVVVPR